MTSSKTLWWPFKPPGANGKKALPKPITPSPSPVPMELPEIEEAKRKVRGRAKKKGRAATILAGRMMAERGTGLKNILG